MSGGRTEGIGYTCVRGNTMENRLYMCQGEGLREYAILVSGVRPW